MGWDNSSTINQGSMASGSNDYLTVESSKRVRVLMFGTDEPATYGTYKVEVPQQDGSTKILSFTSFPGCKLENNRKQAKFAFRNIVNVWDYESGTIKKFGFGTRLKEQLKQLNFTSGSLSGYDINISRIGEKRDTQWFAAPVIGSTPGLPAGCDPSTVAWDIYNLPEFAVVDEQEIARQLAEVGINYEEFTKLPVYTLEEAMAFKLPFSKHKGKTLGEVFSTDTGWITWAAQNANMIDLKMMCLTIQNQLIGGGSGMVTAPPAAPAAPAPVAPAPVAAAPVAPPVAPAVAPAPQAYTAPPVAAPVAQAPVAPPVAAPVAPVAPPVVQATPVAAAPVPQVAPAVQPVQPVAVNPAVAVNRDEILAQIDHAIHNNPVYKDYQKVVEVMREVTAPNPNFDLRSYTDVQLQAILQKVQA